MEGGCCAVLAKAPSLKALKEAKGCFLHEKRNRKKGAFSRKKKKSSTIFLVEEPRSTDLSPGHVDGRVHGLEVRDGAVAGVEGGGGVGAAQQVVQELVRGHRLKRKEREREPREKSDSESN